MSPRPDSPDPVLPVRLFVGVRVERWPWNGNGHLVIERSSLVLEMSPILGRLVGVRSVQHQEALVRVIESRLVPPLFNTHIVVVGGHVKLRAWVPQWTRRRLLDALDAAGFQAVEYPTWFSMGYEYVA